MEKLIRAIKMLAGITSVINDKSGTEGEGSLEKTLKRLLI